MKTIKSIKHLLKISIVPLIALLLGLAPVARADMLPPIVQVCFDGSIMPVTVPYSWQVPSGWSCITLNCALGSIYPPQGTGTVPSCGWGMSHQFTCYSPDHATPYPVTLTQIRNVCTDPGDGCPDGWFAGGNSAALGPGQFGLYGFIREENGDNSIQVSIGNLNNGELYQIDVLDGGPGYYDIYDATLGASNLVANTDGQGGDTLFRTRASGGQIIFQVRVDSASRQPCGLMGFYVTPIVTPPTPTGLQAVADLVNQEVNVSWNPSPGALAYQLWRSTSPGAETLYLSSYGATNYTETVTYGPTYYFKVAAFNAVGTSALSGEVSASLVVPTVPAAPTGLQAVVGNGQIGLSWTAAAGATSYNVKRSTSTGAEVTITNLTATTYTNTALANGTKYYYVVTATNSAGESAPSMEVNATPGIAPPAPTGLYVVAFTNGQIILTWTASTGATSYHVKHSMSSGGTYVTDYMTSAPSCSYNAYALNPGTSYYFEVSAVNAGGESANSSWVSATTPPPAPMLTAVGGNGQVTLSWTPVANATSYIVNRLIYPYTLATNIASPTTAGYTDTNVVNGWPDYYQVASVNGNGVSAWSSLVIATPNINLVVNGGFETGDFTGWTPGDPNDTWALVDDGSQFGIPPHSGNFAACLMGSSSGLGYLSQTLATTPGTNYSISFWVNNYGQDQNEFLVSWNGGTFFGPTGITATGWTNIQLWVTATGPSTVLKFGFEDYGPGDDDSYGVLGFDDVSVGFAPPLPIGLQAVAGNNQVTLAWTSSLGAECDYYSMLRSMNSGGPWMKIGPDMAPTNYVGANTYTDWGVVNGTTYYYEVMGQVHGSSAHCYSYVVSATPSAAAVPTAPKLGGITFTGGGGGCGFCFTNVPGASFTVYATTDLALPFSSWPAAGQPTEVPNGAYSLYQFTDPQATNKTCQFYRVSSP